MGNVTTNLDNEIDQVRKRWEQLANQALEQADQEARIDHRSLEAQSITDRMPSVHLGPTATDIERKGGESDISRRARAQTDEFMAEMQAQVALQRAAEREVAELETQLANLRWQAMPVEDRLKIARAEQQRLVQERSALWERMQQVDEAAKRARPMAEVQAAVKATRVVVKRAIAAQKEVALLRQTEQQLGWWQWLQRQRMAKELPAAAEHAEALVAKAKELEGLANSPVREKVQEAQAKLTAEGNALAEQLESVVMQVGHLEGLQKAQQERQAELEGEKERLRAIEAAATAAVHARVSVEQEAGQPEAMRDHSRDQDFGPSM